MSYQNGWAALNREMPARAHRTEFLLEMHYVMIKEVTRLIIKPEKDVEIKYRASAALIKVLNYDFVWLTQTGNQIFDDRRTYTGYTVYQEGITDYWSEMVTFYSDSEDALKFEPCELYRQRNRMVLIREYDEHFEGQKKLYADNVNVTSLYITTMFGLIDIFGWDNLLMDMGIDYDIVWDIGAFMHPDWYRRFIFLNCKKLFVPLHEARKIIVDILDGNYTEYINNIASYGVNAFVMEPMTDMALIVYKYCNTHGFVGNADIRILLRDSKEDIYNKVKRCVDIGKSYPRFLWRLGII